MCCLAGDEYSRLQPDLIILHFSVVESFFALTRDLPECCFGRTKYGPDLTIPLIFVGNKSDLRWAKPYRDQKQLTEEEVKIINYLID